MTSDRPYRHVLSHDIAAGELRRGAGTLFDPTIVAAFLEALDSRQADEPAPADSASCLAPAVPQPRPVPQGPCS